MLHLQRTVGNQAVQRLQQAEREEAGPNDAPGAGVGQAISRVRGYRRPATGIQRKPILNEPGDAYEQEANRVAAQMMAPPGPHAAGPTVPAIQRVAEGSNRSREAAPGVVAHGLTSAGRPLESSLRQDMEQRFRYDFSAVRVHTSSDAAASARSLGARAFTRGRDIVFGAAQYAPGTAAGRSLLAHELTHVVQQQGTRPAPDVVQRDLYLPSERRAMAEGRMQGTDLDRQIASDCDFQPGDIVFRMGSRQLASRMGEPVTHGGIYIGDGLIHDMVGFGNRTVPVTMFYAEADDASVVKIVRFIGPLRELIVQRVVANVLRRDFDLPTDSVPWNLFSTSADYQTATCLEYSHAQFLHAIHQLAQDASQPPEVRQALRRTYFSAGSSSPNPLIAPRRLRGSWYFSTLERNLLVAAADYLAEDVDPTVFENRWEGNEDESIDAFTYSSFVNATQFFTALDCAGAGPGAAATRFQRQVLPIVPRTSRNVTDPVDRTISNQVGVVWAMHSNGQAYLALISITNSSYPHPDRTAIRFRTFIDEDLRDRALARARLRQPRGIQTLPWAVIRDIPSGPPSTAARRAR